MLCTSHCVSCWAMYHQLGVFTAEAGIVPSKPPAIRYLSCVRTQCVWLGCLFLTVYCDTYLQHIGCIQQAACSTSFKGSRAVLLCTRCMLLPVPDENRAHMHCTSARLRRSNSICLHAGLCVTKPPCVLQHTNTNAPRHALPVLEAAVLGVSCLLVHSATQAPGTASGMLFCLCVLPQAVVVYVTSWEWHHHGTAHCA